MSNNSDDSMGMVSFVVFLMGVIAFGVYDCTSNYKEKTISELRDSREREKIYLESCSKTQPVHECAYRWQSALKDAK